MEKANLKCPHCGHIQEVEIPENKCLAFLKCKDCEKIISAPNSECCVICAYSDKKCFSKRKSKTNKSKVFKMALLLLTFWILIIASGFLYVSFIDSNLYHYIKMTKKEDSSADILKKYQAILDELAKLNEREMSDSKAKEEIEKLAQEIHDLHILNPYYKFKSIKASSIPTGVPEVYGAELSISFDKVQESISILEKFDPTYGIEKIELTEDEEKERYIKIGKSIACEYCCGVEALVKDDGEAACGCAHSQAMRGLTAYLLKNHPSDYSDEAVLDELSKWKAVFFPKQTIQKILDEKKEAGEEGIEELLTEFPEFLPEMVGGC
jgi:hypothetical protein